ncbi:outer membrane protein assembly factor BamE [Paraburkholderia caribensis]|uniref:outer membrane protein assembly factor BamE n=1 Tax=Paraburkholderia caribensis TaxID=75105 RepID=UPI0006D465B1|nr:outer membrane protein assembly factor BamE [Paraburkholderia caribensis]ALP61983.1 cell envelope protein SmpA [Paraburkholderia caribensis]AMV43707.1 cell envelope protein SmpA [Paraburkholderia caribensis]AUT52785.1 outer membrane protein assembly factor BamE [Paraburkholderia caribensis]
MIPKALLINRGSRVRRTLIVAAAVAVLAGCSTYDSLTQRVAQSITPYRITVVQGNFVSKEAAAQMQVGMSRAQVRQVLGTPLLSDMFHADRWDYVFYFKRGSTAVVQQRDFIVMFTGDRVASWSGGEDLPSNLELLAEIDGDRTGKKVKAAPVVASATAEASGAAAAAAPAPVAVPDTVRSATSDAAQAGSLPAVDANAQAAQAANRLTNAVQSPAPGTTPSVRANTPPSNGGVPQNSTEPGQPQFRFTRPPPPQMQGVPSDNPVGPTGPTGPESNNGQSKDAPAKSSQSSSQSATGTGTGG